MGTYFDNDGEANLVDLLEFKWRVVPEAEYDEIFDDTSFKESLDEGFVAIMNETGTLDRHIIKNLDPDYPEGDLRFEVEFIQDGALLKAVKVCYPVRDDKVPYHRGDEIELNQREEEYFTELVREALKGYVDDTPQEFSQDAVRTALARIWGQMEAICGDAKLKSVLKDTTFEESARLINSWTEEYSAMEGVPLLMEFFISRAKAYAKERSNA